jgi:CheY-like chemotaxis protein
MNKQGHILIIDDSLRWCEELTEILRREGYNAASATSAAEALEMLNEAFYHVLVVDIRMNEADQSNIDGITLLQQLHKRSLSDATKVIMLSAYGTKERTRTAFREYEVADFLFKDEFNKQLFLESVRNAFAEKVKINLALDIHWQQGSGPEQAVQNLEIEGAYVMRGTPLHSQVTAELEDLLCRLFYEAKSLLVRPLTPGKSGAGILWAQPFYATGGGGYAVAVKFGDFHKVEQEYDNFKQYVQPFLGGGHNTTIQELRRTPRLGGIIYSLLGTTYDQLANFDEFYRRADVPQIHDALDQLFRDICGTWYASRGDLQLLDLTADYQRLLSYNLGMLERVRFDQLSSVQGKHQLYFRALKENRNRSFTNPMLAIEGESLARPTYECITHGDFHHHNLLVDSTGHIWLIDFQDTAQSHILRDVAILDSVVRFQLLMPEEATLEERLQMEEALCTIERFSQVEKLTTIFTTQNQALAKAYATVVHLRIWARKLVELNPDDDISEYYIALLYIALNTVGFSSLSPIQREHALLCGSLLVDRLGLGGKNTQSTYSSNSG